MNTPAFPTWSAKDVVQGMTLRDFFATAALQGLLTANPPLSPTAIVNIAYKYADAMMEARNAA
jgi:hypothetical protein